MVNDGSTEILFFWVLHLDFSALSYSRVWIPSGLSYSRYAVYGGVNQVYSRLLTTHGHITDCKLDSVVYAGVAVYGYSIAGM